MSPEAQVGSVQRIVPGRLVYVSTAQDQTYAFTPNYVVIQKNDGSFRHYRGEPFSELGLDVGRPVMIFQPKPNRPEVFMLHSTSPSFTNELFSPSGRSDLASKTLRYLEMYG